MPQSGDLRARLEGFARRGGARELGRFLVTGNSLDIGAFRTPSLRDVELTAPYFHDGSAATLKDVLKFYARGGNDNPMRDWELQTLDLDDRELGIRAAREPHGNDVSIAIRGDVVRRAELRRDPPGLGARRPR